MVSANCVRTINTSYDDDYHQTEHCFPSNIGISRLNSRYDETQASHSSSQTAIIGHLTPEITFILPQVEDENNTDNGYGNSTKTNISTNAYTQLKHWKTSEQQHHLNVIDDFVNKIFKRRTSFNKIVPI